MAETACVPRIRSSVFPAWRPFYHFHLKEVRESLAAAHFGVKKSPALMTPDPGLRRRLQPLVPRRGDLTQPRLARLCGRAARRGNRTQRPSGPQRGRQGPLRGQLWRSLLDPGCARKASRPLGVLGYRFAECGVQFGVTLSLNRHRRIRHPFGAITASAPPDRSADSLIHELFFQGLTLIHLAGTPCANGCSDLIQGRKCVFIPRILIHSSRLKR